MKNTTTHPITISDLERIADIIADGLYAARRGASQLRHLIADLSPNGLQAATDVEAACGQRKFLDDSFREALQILIDELDTMCVGDEYEGRHYDANRQLTTALTLSHRASDLIAAEKEAGRARGLIS